MIKLLLVLLLSTFMLPAYSTTIAFDGKGLAADSQITHGGSKSMHGHKLAMINGCVVGCAGDCAIIEQFKKWLHDPSKAKPKLGDNFEALVVLPGGTCVVYDNDLTPMPIEAPFAIGSGSDAAMGAMMGGSDAKQAVEIAKQIDLYTGGAVVYMQPDIEMKQAGSKHGVWYNK